MEMKTTIKLNQPKELPATGLTTVQFKPWKNHVITFLMQDPDNQEFLSGGIRHGQGSETDPRIGQL